MSDALCVGKHELFDSHDPDDHKQARRLCYDCPIRSWCASEAVAVKQTHKTVQGTWAGKLHGKGRPSPEAIAAENAMFTLEELRKAHAAYASGDRSVGVVRRERVYQRTRVRPGRRVA